MDASKNLMVMAILLILMPFQAYADHNFISSVSGSSAEIAQTLLEEYRRLSKSKDASSQQLEQIHSAIYNLNDLQVKLTETKNHISLNEQKKSHMELLWRSYHVNYASLRKLGMTSELRGISRLNEMLYGTLFEILGVKIKVLR